MSTWTGFRALRTLSILVFVFFITTSVESQASSKPTAVGNTGLTLKIPQKWTKTVLNRDLVADQYLASLDMGVMIFAVESPMADEGTLSDILGNVSRSVFKQSGTLPIDIPTIESNGRKTLSKRFNYVEQGLKISYLYASTSYEGYIVSVMAWTKESAFDSMKSEIFSTLDTLSVDRNADAWKRHTKFTTSYVYPRSGALLLSWQSSVWDINNGEKLLKLDSLDNSVSVEFVELPEGTNPSNYYAKLRLRLAKEWPNISSKEKASFSLGEGRQYIWEAFLQSDNTDKSVLCCLVTISDTMSLELRISGTMNLGSQKNLAQKLLSHMKIFTDEADLPFPKSVDKVKKGEKVTDSNLQKESKLEFDFASDLNKFVIDDKGKFIFMDKEGLYSIEEGEPKLIHADEFNYSSSFATSDSGFLALVGIGSPKLVGSTKGQSPTWTATKIWSTPGSKAVLAGESIDGSPLVAELWQAEDPASRLVYQPNNGKPKVYATIDGTIETLAFNKDGQLLVAWTDGLIKTKLSKTIHLDLYEPKGLVKSVENEFESVSGIIASEKSWLISGTQTNGQDGIWVLDAKGFKLLSRAPIVPLASKDGRIWYSTSISPLTQQEEWDHYWIYSIALQNLQSLKLEPQDLTPANLNWVAGQVNLVENYPSLDQAGLIALNQKIDSLLVSQFGVTLPKSPSSFDHLIDQLAYESQLNEGGQRVLVVSLCAILLANSCQWVPPTASWTGQTGSPDTDAKSPFCRSWNVAEAVRSALYDEDGWYHPAESIIDNNAIGITKLIGLDNQSLIKMEQDLQDPMLARLLIKPKAKEIGDWLNSSRHAQNLELRARVYSWLLQHEYNKELAALLDEKTGDLESEALRTTFRALISQLGEFSKYRPSFGDIWSAAKLRPSEHVLFYFLGLAWENSNDEASNEKALACYRKIEHFWNLAPGLKTRVSDAIQKLESRLGGRTSTDNEDSL